MSTPITYDINTVPESRPKSRGLLARFLERLIAAREAQAKRYLVNYLSLMSDERLRDLGYSDQQIRELRVERRLPEKVA